MRCGRLVTKAATMSLAVRWRWGAAVMAAVAVLGSGATASAQGATGTVTGRVTDAAAGTPVSGAAVRIVGTTNGAQTDDQGRYTVRAVASGAQSIQVNRIGYTAQTVAVTVTAGGTATANVSLTQAAFSLAAVVTTVTGQQRKVELANTTSQISVAEKVAELPVNTMVPGALRPRRWRAGRERRRHRVRLAHPHPRPVVAVAQQRSRRHHRRRPRHLRREQPRGRHRWHRPVAPRRHQPRGDREHRGPQGPVGGDALRHRSGERRHQHHDQARQERARRSYNVYGENGLVDNIRDFPELYSLWGKSAGQTTSRICTLANVVSGCVVDSLSHGNYPEHRLAHADRPGMRRQYGAQMSGGNDRVQFFVSGETEGERGIYKMPQRDINQLLQLAAA